MAIFHQRQRGFTLLEILIAMAIFSLIGLASSQVLFSVLTSDEVSQASAKQLTAMQRSYQIIQRDVMQMAPRATRVDGDEPKEHYILTGEGVLDGAGHGIAFNRLGWRNPAQIFPRGTTQPVGYRLFENKLQRLHYLYPDQAGDTEVKSIDLLENVEQLRFEYFTNKKWHKRWGQADLPQGIAFILTTKKYGEIRWQFLVPGPQQAGQNMRPGP